MKSFAMVLVFMLFAVHAHAVHFPNDNVIFHKKSLYRNILVTEGENYRCMSFGKMYGQQTCINPNDSNDIIFAYYRGLLTATAFSAAPKRILVLGLGGGVIPSAFARIYPDTVIDAVELDSAVVDVARTYFKYQDSARLLTHVDDARVFVRHQLRAKVQYDIIVLDAFDKEYIPEHLLTKEFLTQVKGVLAPNGIVAANTFTRGRQVMHENATYQTVFPKVFDLDVGEGNRIILAPMSPDAFAEQCRTIKSLPKLAAFNFDAFALFGKITLLIKSNAKPFTDQYSPVNII